MKRRNFVGGLALVPALGFPSCGRISKRLEESDKSEVTGPVAPPRLATGQTVALICPGGPIDRARLDRTVAAVSAFGLNVKIGKNALARDGFNAGTEEQRLEDLHDAYRDEEVDAIWAIRGGYGCTQLLPRIDFDLIGKAQKLLIGYSDITALLNAIYQRAGVAGLHGPVASSSFDDFSTSSFQAVAFDAAAETTYNALPSGKTYVGGSATGRLVGGNLSLIAAMCGTPFQIDCRDKILLLEDVGEAPYRIDRMLVQLIQCMDLSRAAGIALGDFVDCEAEPGAASLSLENTLRRRLSTLGIPVYHGLPFGHGSANATLGIGGRATLDADNGRITLTERAVR